MAQIKQELKDLITTIDKMADGVIAAEEMENVYTTAVMVNDEYEGLDTQVQSIVELLDNEAKTLSKQELVELSLKLQRYLQ